jgi:hypothetical protein
MDTPYFIEPARGLRPSRELSNRVSQVAILLGKLALPAAFVTLAMVNVGFLDRMPELCVFRTLFGVCCPGCGMTHAFCSVLHGQFALAFAYNPLVIIAFPFFANMAVRNLRALLYETVVAIRSYC